MKLLLDTHIWLWALLDPARLGADVRAALESPDNEIWLSPVSVWEALMLAERRRLGIPGDTQAWIRQMVSAMPRREATLTHEIAMASRQMALSHEDPADRFLAATAHVLDLTLVTADERLLAGAPYATMPNH